MIKSVLTRIGLSLLMIVCAALISCSDDKESGTGPGDGGGSGPSSEFADQLGTIEQNYLTANAEAFGSLETMAEFIAASFIAKRSIGDDKALGALGCFGSLTPGTTYTFNGSTYEASGLTGAPMDGVRFVLYEIMNGTPNISNSIGYFELRCSESPALLITGTLVVNAVTILQFSLYDLGGGYQLTGSISTPVPGGTGLQVEFNYSDILVYETEGIVLEFGAYTAFYTAISYKTESQVDSIYTIANLTRYDLGDGGYILWEQFFHIWSYPSGTISVGNTIFSDSFGATELTGCLSGDISSPTITSASETTCLNLYGETPTGSLNDAEISALSTGYLVLRTLHLTVKGIFEAGLGVYIN